MIEKSHMTYMLTEELWFRLSITFIDNIDNIVKDVFFIAWFIKMLKAY